MIPPHKLARLPRSQRLRKMVKIFAEAEHRFCMALAESAAGFVDHNANETGGPLLDPARLNSCAGAADLLVADGEFAAPAIAAFSAAALVFRRPVNAAAVRRALNTVRHLLLAETGRSPADWDFIDNRGRLDTARRRPFVPGGRQKNRPPGTGRRRRCPPGLHRPPPQNGGADGGFCH